MAHYILDSPLPSSKAEAVQARWAWAFICGVQMTVRRLFRLLVVHSLPITVCSLFKVVGQPPTKKRIGKKGVNDRKKSKTKYGVVLPCTWDQAVKKDLTNGNKKWWL